jgi:plasmid stabilization system protein ParE
VTSVIWAPRALTAFRRERTYLERQRDGTGILFERDVAQAIRHIASLPLGGRSAFVGDLRIWSLTNWRKTIIYKVEDESVKIVAFRDTRQDT